MDTRDHSHDLGLRYPEDSFSPVYIDPIDVGEAIPNELDLMSPISPDGYHIFPSPSTSTSTTASTFTFSENDPFAYYEDPGIIQERISSTDSLVSDFTTDGSDKDLEFIFQDMYDFPTDVLDPLGFQSRRVSGLFA